MGLRMLIGAFLIFMFQTLSKGQRPCSQEYVDRYLKNVLKGSNSSYDYDIAPQYPVSVKAVFSVKDVVELNELNGNIVINLQFLAMWTDPRLRLPCVPPSGRVALSYRLHDALWRPSLALSGATQGYRISSPLSVQATEIRYDGRVKFQETFSARYPCQANYKLFPFDVIHCNLFMGGFDGPATVNTTWIGGKPVFFPPWVTSGSFSFDGVGFGQDEPNYEMSDKDDAPVPLIVGDFFRMAGSNSSVVSLNLRRQYSYYILAMYLPSLVIDIIGWVSMWFPFDGSRVSICLTCVVSVMLQYVNISSQLPKVGYIKGIDVWMFGSLLFLALILGEVATLTALKRDKADDSPAPKMFQKKGAAKDKVVTVEKMIKHTDNVMKWVLFVLFTLFTILYFMTCFGVILSGATRNAQGFGAFVPPK